MPTPTETPVTTVTPVLPGSLEQPATGEYTYGAGTANSSPSLSGEGGISNGGTGLQGGPSLGPPGLE